MLRADAPVDPEILRQERRRHEPGAVVHPALAGELAHPGIDERKPRAALLPGRQRLGVVDPLVPARAQVLVRRLGTGGEELRVEVAPAELPDEGAGGRAARRDLTRREAAEVEVGAEPRGLVQPVLVAREAVGDPALEPADGPRSRRRGRARASGRRAGSGSSPGSRSCGGRSRAAGSGSPAGTRRQARQYAVKTS